MLLGSDVSAFGAEGVALELDLLLRTGRAAAVRNWTSEEFKGSLGAAGYHWLRAQADTALGEYADADAELAELAGEGPDPAQAGRVFAVLAGRALLDQQPTGLGWPDFRQRRWPCSSSRVPSRRPPPSWAGGPTPSRCAACSALEAGEVDPARAAFRAALALSADSPAGGGLEFAGRAAAWEALGLLASSGEWRRGGERERPVVRRHPPGAYAPGSPSAERLPLGPRAAGRSRAA